MESGPSLESVIGPSKQKKHVLQLCDVLSFLYLTEYEEPMLPAVEPLSSQFSRRAIYQVAFYDVDEERLTSDFWLSSLSGEEVENLEVDLVCIPRV